jgi:hypothetical protein
MKPYIPVEYQKKVKYPSLSDVKIFTEYYRIGFMNREEPDKGFYKFSYSREVEVLVIGGMENYFLVYAYPPAGVTIVVPKDVLALELYRGWILHLVNYEPTYTLDTATYREGYVAFKRRKTWLGY